MRAASAVATSRNKRRTGTRAELTLSIHTISVSVTQTKSSTEEITSDNISNDFTRLQAEEVAFAIAWRIFAEFRLMALRLISCIPFQPLVVLSRSDQSRLCLSCYGQPSRIAEGQAQRRFFAQSTLLIRPAAVQLRSQQRVMEGQGTRLWGDTELA